MGRIGGKNFEVNIGDLSVTVEKITLDIEDATGVAKDGGVPNGYVDGEVSASGEIELDAANVNLLIEAARSAGSFRQLPVFDTVFYANTGTEEMKVEAFGCKLRIASLLDIDRKGGEKHNSKIPYDVTSPDFVHINGVPYLAASEIDNL